MLAMGSLKWAAGEGGGGKVFILRLTGGLLAVIINVLDGAELPRLLLVLRLWERSSLP